MDGNVVGDNNQIRHPWQENIRRLIISWHQAGTTRERCDLFDPNVSLRNPVLQNSRNARNAFGFFRFIFINFMQQPIEIDYFKENILLRVFDFGWSPRALAGSGHCSNVRINSARASGPLRPIDLPRQQRFYLVRYIRRANAIWWHKLSNIWKWSSRSK